MSEIRGSGFGAAHKFVRGQTVKTLYNEVKGTDWECARCGVCFKHCYGVESSIFDAIKKAGVPEECKPEKIVCKHLPQPEIDRIAKNVGYSLGWQAKANSINQQIWQEIVDKNLSLLFVMGRHNYAVVYTSEKQLPRWIMYDEKKKMWLSGKELELVFGNPDSDFSTWPSAIKHIDTNEPLTIIRAPGHRNAEPKTETAADVHPLLIKLYPEAAPLADRIAEAKREGEKLAWNQISFTK